MKNKNTLRFRQVLICFISTISLILYHNVKAQIPVSYETDKFDTNLYDDSAFGNDAENAFIKNSSEQEGGKHRRKRSDFLPDGKVGFGTFFKQGYFTGNISNLLTDYQVFKPFYMDLRIQNIYIDLGFSAFSKMGEIKKVTMADKIYEGEFYGRFFEFYSTLGYAAYKGWGFSIVPTLSATYMFYKVNPLQSGFFTYYDLVEYVDESKSRILGIGPGVFMDFKLVSFGKWNEADISVRTRYNAYFVPWEKLYNTTGMIHEFSIGILFSAGFDI